MAPQQQGSHLHFVPPPGPNERSISSCWVTLVAVKRRAVLGSSRNDESADQDIIGVGDFFAAAFHLPGVRPRACKKYRQTCGICDVYRQRLRLAGGIRTLVSLLESGK
jgi:hypothetical protein